MGYIRMERKIKEFTDAIAGVPREYTLKCRRKVLNRISILITVLCISASIAETALYRSPQAMAISPGGEILYVAEAGSRTIARIETKTGTLLDRIQLPAEPTGLAISKDASRLYATSAAPEGTVSEIDLAANTVAREIAAGHGARAPILNRDGRRLYVCNRFDNTVSVIDFREGRESALIRCTREPYCAVLSGDGGLLFVGGHLPTQPANGDYAACEVSIIDLKRNEIRHTIPLPNGSTGLRDIAISPDGRHVFVTHLIARYGVPTSQLEQGWMNTNVVSVIDAESGILIESVLLDQADYGAANPWGVVCTPGGRHICVTHAGTHEVSVIDYHGLIEKLSSPAKRSVPVSQDLSFLYGLRKRLKLPGKGPRVIISSGSSAYISEYFSDSIVQIEFDGRPRIREVFTLSSSGEMTPERTGHLLFNDAALCFQQWQSCASCHPDGRADGLNWDLLNDGIGNPKNTLSLLLAHRTPPAMSTRVRANAEAAVRAGIRHIQFADRPEEDAQALDAWLKSMKAVASPILNNGRLSRAAENGKLIFNREDVGCARCHPEPLFTDLKSYDVGTHSASDFVSSAEGKRVPQIEFDTPTLVEIWRTAPYLHDGRYATLEDLIRKGRHGLDSSLYLHEHEAQDLIEYLLSL